MLFMFINIKPQEAPANSLEKKKKKKKKVKIFGIMYRFNQFVLVTPVLP